MKNTQKRGRKGGQSSQMKELRGSTEEQKAEEQEMFEDHHDVILA